MKACIVQARLTSKRLPAKMMLSLGGEPAISHVLKRCKQIPGIDKVVCAIPENDSKPIAREARKLGVKVIRGSEHDVLSRYHKAAEAVGADIIMRITGDCPLIDPEICGKVLAMMKDDVDYASNILPRGFPRGLDCECFTFDALDQANRMTDEPYDREHVTPWMQRNLYCVSLIGNDNPELDWCLDTLENYLFLSERFA